jgi:hypothetical protein
VFSALSVVFLTPFAVSEGSIAGSQSSVAARESSAAGHESSVVAPRSSAVARPSSVGAPRSFVVARESSVVDSQSSIAGCGSQSGAVMPGMGQAPAGLYPFFVPTEVQFYVFDSLYEMLFDNPVHRIEHGIVVKDFRVFGEKKENGNFQCL